MVWPGPRYLEVQGSYLCFSQDQEVPHWVPSRLTRTVEVHHENDSAALQDADNADPVEDDPKQSGAEMAILSA